MKRIPPPLGRDAGFLEGHAPSWPQTNEEAMRPANGEPPERQYVPGNGFECEVKTLRQAGGGSHAQQGFFIRFVYRSFRERAFQQIGPDI